MKKFIKKMAVLLIAFAMTITSLLSAEFCTAYAANNIMNIKTQMQLEQALENELVRKIVIKGNKELSLVIPRGEYSDKTLIVNAAKATLVNKGTFNKITLKKICEYNDLSQGNRVNVTAKTAIVNISKKSKDTIITLNKAKADVCLDIKCNIKRIVVRKAAKLNITGNQKNVLKLKIKDGAEKTTVFTDLKLNADKEITVITPNQDGAHIPDTAEDKTEEPGITEENHNLNDAESDSDKTDRQQDEDTGVSEETTNTDQETPDNIENASGDISDNSINKMVMSLREDLDDESTTRKIILNIKFVNGEQVITKNNIDALSISKVSDNDSVVLGDVRQMGDFDSFDCDIRVMETGEKNAIDIVLRLRVLERYVNELGVETWYSREKNVELSIPAEI